MRNLFVYISIINAVGILTICILICICIVLLMHRKKTSTALAKLLKKNNKQEKLLEKLLPTQTAEELQKSGKVEIEHFKMVSVLFADIKDFSKIIDEYKTQETVFTLDIIFKAIDKIVKRNNIEKIKTIGDGYMCAGGVPQKNSTNAIEIVIVGLMIQKYMKHLYAKDKKYKRWRIRIGIHTGPILAGVIGYEKLSYDLWGETVNTANRMESYGSAEEINISRTTYIHIKDFFDCEYRGEIFIKHNKIEHMYYVKNLKPEFGNIYKLNEEFKDKINSIKYFDLEEIILEKLKTELPDKLQYHNIKHTIDVINSVEIISQGEKINEHDLILMKTAALLHDVGFTIAYDNHEENSCLIAKQELKKLDYPNDYINRVCKLIMATDSMSVPKNILEKILNDADLDYLGRSDYLEISAKLFRELKNYNKIHKLRDWNQLQIKFIERHQYYTSTAKENRNVDKQRQLDKLRELQ